MRDDSVLGTLTNIEPVLERGRTLVARVREQIRKRIVGQDEVVEGLLVSLLAGGHVLVEGVPGLGKTLLVRTLAETLGLAFKRVQCTPDLMPADILGTTILHEGPHGERRFEFQEGPIFTHILLADEVNRATPKTQSALLEAMQEAAVTIAGERRVLDQPFFVMATQNPIEMEGTFPLPEAQLDRFLLKVSVEVPSLDELEEIVDRTTGSSLSEVERVVAQGELLALRYAVRQVLVPRPVKRFALRLVDSSHPLRDASPQVVKRFVRYGSSPRGAQALILGAKVRAALEGRPNVAFEDVRAMAQRTLAHRIVLSFEGEAEGSSGRSIVAALLDEVVEVESGEDLEAI